MKTEEMRANVNEFFNTLTAALANKNEASNIQALTAGLKIAGETFVNISRIADALEAIAASTNRMA